jgi:hypothetical protein
VDTRIGGLCNASFARIFGIICSMIAPDSTRAKPGALTVLVMLVIFSACGTAGFKTAGMAGDAIILRWVYGSQRVAREHLNIISLKPDPKVSNGDVLNGYGFPHFLIGVPVFLATGAGGFLLSMCLLPARMRHVVKQNSRKDPGFGCLAVIVFLPLSVYLATTHGLWSNIIVLLIAIGGAWVAEVLGGRPSEARQPLEGR